MIDFVRSPAAHGSAREVLVQAGDVTLSGLLAEPEGAPRGLLVAVHGAEVHAGYFHAATDPALSLLEAGVAAGLTVWAPDRPGVGAAADLDDEQVKLRPQAATLNAGVDALRATLGFGGATVLVAHSYGFKVALAMLAKERGQHYAGLASAGQGVRNQRGFRYPQQEPQPGERGPAWGPSSLYPDGTFRRRALSLHPMPDAQRNESAAWAEDFPELAVEVTVPVQLVWGDHERIWRTDDEHFDELRSLLRNAPDVTTEIVADAGHNISLGFSAREYHQHVITFAEACLARVAAR